MTQTEVCSSLKRLWRRSADFGDELRILLLFMLGREYLTGIGGTSKKASARPDHGRGRSDFIDSAGA